MNNSLYPVPSSFKTNAHLSQSQYQTMYKESIEEPQSFWAQHSQQLISWFEPWESVTRGDFSTGEVKWFVKGKLNACYNCLDRHLETRKNKVAIIWEGNNPNDSKYITYGELFQQVCQFANALKAHGIKKGDRVCIYLPMIPEAAVAMLACARIGAIHSVVFGGFSPESLKTRINDAECMMVITADEGLRGNKTVPLKANVDQAIEACPSVKSVMVVKHTGGEIQWEPKRDIWFHEAMEASPTDCPVEYMDSSDPLFILYTSGSTGQPKGILHGTGGYLVYTAMTFKYVFDYHEEDVYWCTADVGWITGHSYLIYGPLTNGATTLLFEGVPNYPTVSRFWEVIDKHQVTIFYTAPTAIRALRKEGDEWVKKSSRQSLRLLGTVGEPINPDVWTWYHEVVGDGHCPIVDTWWQTETGGIMLTPLPGATDLKPGSVCQPFFGILPEIVDNEGNPVKGDVQGRLIIKQPWPGMMQTIWGDKQRFYDTYFKPVPNAYLTGDGAHQDSDGYYWITGRNDDVIMVSGHRLGTEELESALLKHQSVSEAAVVGIPNDLTGECIYGFVTLKTQVEKTDALKAELVQHVRKEIGPIATLETIQWASALPKTRSGKIMRRILRKIASNHIEDLGDISTLAEPHVVQQLIENRAG